MKKLTQRDRHALFLGSLVSNVAATLREGFAAAPGVQSITICALVRFEQTQRLGPVLLGRWNRAAVEAVPWGRDGDAHDLVLDRNVELHLTSRPAARRDSCPHEPYRSWNHC